MKQEISKKALELGFSTIGFTKSEGLKEWHQRLEKYSEQKLYGDMNWLVSDIDKRANPNVFWQEAKTIIVLGINAKPTNEMLKAKDHKEQGRIAFYAQGKDYHKIIKKKLKIFSTWLCENYGGETKGFVDSAPIMEKPIAEKAGLGWQGKNSILVSKEFGCFLLLGELFTTLEIEADEPSKNFCGSCNKCKEACPTGAILPNGGINPLKCIAYFTIEHKEKIPKEMQNSMGNRIYGCDECILACPFNKFSPNSINETWERKPELSSPYLKDLASLNETAFLKMFEGSPVKRIGYKRFMRNVKIALKNNV